MKHRIIGACAIAFIVVAGTVALHSCKKDNENILSNNSKVVKNGMIVNPFEQYGIWHNECLAMMRTVAENDSTLTYEAIWIACGVQHFQNVLGVNYTPTPVGLLHETYAKALDVVENKNHLNILQELVDVGLINPDYASPCIDRNNYQILEDYFTFLVNYDVTTEGEYWFAHEKLCETEQEILANYYALVEASEIENDPELENEYEVTLSYMALTRNSSEYWGMLPIIDNYPHKKDAAEVDATAHVVSTLQQLENHGSASTSFAAADASYASGRHGGPPNE